VQKPAAGNGHLLGVVKAADAVRIGDEIGKGVQMDQQPGDEAGQKGPALLGGDPAPARVEPRLQRAPVAFVIRQKGSPHCFS